MKIGLKESLHSELKCSECGGFLRSPSAVSPIDFHHLGPCSLNNGYQVAMLSDRERFKRNGSHVRLYSDPELTLIRDAGYRVASDGHVRLYGGRRGIAGFSDPAWEYVGLETEEDSSDDNGTD